MIVVTRFDFGAITFQAYCSAAFRVFNSLTCMYFKFRATLANGYAAGDMYKLGKPLKSILLCHYRSRKIGHS